VCEREIGTLGKKERRDEKGKAERERKRERDERG